MNLQKQTVSPTLWKLLKLLMEEPLLEHFHLAGGTALALRFGHRRSVDIDLFTGSEFDASALANQLTDEFKAQEIVIEKNTVRGLIDGIKIDLIAHRYNQLQPVENIEGIRILSNQDIAAMKLNAIANRGSKKDFWDYAKLLTCFTREQMLSLYAQKYPNSSLWNDEKSLSYFDDAEFDPDPIDLESLDWEQVKLQIKQSNRFANEEAPPQG